MFTWFTRTLPQPWPPPFGGGAGGERDRSLGSGVGGERHPSCLSRLLSLVGDCLGERASLDFSSNGVSKHCFPKQCFDMVLVKLLAKEQLWSKFLHEHLCSIAALKTGINYRWHYMNDIRHLLQCMYNKTCKEFLLFVVHGKTATRIRCSIFEEETHDFCAQHDLFDNYRLRREA